MKKYIIGIILFILLLSTVLIITIINKKSIIGIWKSVGKEKDYYYIFNANKTCSYEMKAARLDCTYEEDDSKLTILYAGNDKPITFQYRFDKKVLIITDTSGKDNIFIRVK